MDAAQLPLLDPQAVQNSNGSKASETPKRALVSAVATLTLSILGSSLLPLPFAFSRTGVALGILTMLVVGACNTLSCHLLLRCAAATGHDSYEGVAESIGGRPWKVVTQVSLMALLFGTLCGDFALLCDVGLRAVDRLWLSDPPDWLMAGQGRVIVLFIAVLLVLPLCSLRRMRSLEMAAYGGFVVVIIIIAIVLQNAVSTGFPAVRSGEFKIWSLEWNASLPEAFAVLGFAFYIQPMLMPLVAEMPSGSLGIRLTYQAVTIVVMGVAVVVYGLLGIFGAARFGMNTQGDLLVNTWLGGRAEGVLDAAMVAYLATSMPPIQLSLRYTLTCLVAGEDAPFCKRRHVTLTALIVGSSLGVALLLPTFAEKIFAFTGATAVAVVCYLLPVALHLLLRRKERRAQVLISEADESAPNWQLPASSWHELLREVVLPIVVLAIGVGVSMLAIGPLLFPQHAEGGHATNLRRMA